MTPQLSTSEMFFDLATVLRLAPAGDEYCAEAYVSLLVAKRFSFDVTAIPDDVYEASRHFAEELFRAGKFRLPYDDVAYHVRFNHPDNGGEGDLLLVAKQREGKLKCFCAQPEADGRWLVPSTPIDVSLYRQTTKRPLHEEEVDTFSMLCIMTALLSKRGVAVEPVSASDRVNRKRMARGEIPLFSYNIVSIDPTLRRSAKSSGGGTHSSPRLHLRRGFYRTLSGGKVVPVKSCLVGVGDFGVVEKEYRVAQAKKPGAHVDAP